MSYLTFSSWNVRSGINTSQQERIVLSLGRKDIDFCACQEIRLKGKGTMDFSVKDHEKDVLYHYTLIYSGTEKGGQHGVGVFFKTCRKKDLLEWRVGLEFPERILIVSFTGCIIISFYGFTETTRSKKNQCLLIQKTRNCYMQN